MKMEVSKYQYEATATITISDIETSEVKDIMDTFTDKVLGIQKAIPTTTLDVASFTADTHHNWKKIVQWEAARQRKLGMYNKISLIKFMRYSIPGMGLKDAKDLVDYADGNASEMAPMWFKFQS